MVICALEIQILMCNYLIHFLSKAFLFSYSLSPSPLLLVLHGVFNYKQELVFSVSPPRHSRATTHSPAQLERVFRFLPKKINQERIHCLRRWILHTVSFLAKLKRGS